MELASITSPRVIIAAPASGSGKTTITMGLIASLARETRVQSFKVGPDYIDPGYHAAASGRPARNLDTWMLSPSQMMECFVRATAGADISIIEGVMGLFDGFGDALESGSTAEVAKLLQSPVILVINAAKMARSAGALVLGFHTFDPDLTLAGVICNNVAGSAHARWVTRAIESIGLPVLGCVPRADALHLPERHLGLHTAIERHQDLPLFLEKLAETLRHEIDVKRIITIAQTAPPILVQRIVQPTLTTRTRIAVARDEAFCFYYEDNLDLLREAGAETVFFSPLHDRDLPAGISGLYFGGGYPELYAEQLSRNQELRKAIRHAHFAGMPIYAECGGFMYLTESISDLDGLSHSMVGLVPGRCTFTKQLKMGYRSLTAACDSLLLRCGEYTRGHEFHYSEWTDRPAKVPAAYLIAARESNTPRQEGFAHRNLLASYIHLHFAAHSDLAPRFVRACLGETTITGRFETSAIRSRT